MGRIESSQSMAEAFEAIGNVAPKLFDKRRGELLATDSESGQMQVVAEWGSGKAEFPIILMSKCTYFKSIGNCAAHTCSKSRKCNTLAKQLGSPAPQ